MDKGVLGDLIASVFDVNGIKHLGRVIKRLVCDRYDEYGVGQHCRTFVFIIQTQRCHHGKS